jgi:2-polyprenyl-6-methoxyphenol hydroxylase-like FAD-dependent oxidoreductase
LLCKCRFLGSVQIDVRGKHRATRADASAVGFERRQLAQLLKEQTQARHPERVTFRFGLRCVSADLEAQKILFRPVRAAEPQPDATTLPKDSADDELETFKYDLLIGADGQNSRVRDLLDDQVEGFSVDRQSSGRSFQPFVDLPATDTLEPPEWRADVTNPGGRSLFLWTSKVRGYTLSMNRRPDGSFAGNLTAKGSLLAELDTVEKAKDLMNRAFTGVPEQHVARIAEQVRGCTQCTLRSAVNCTRYLLRWLELAATPAALVRHLRGMFMTQSCPCAFVLAAWLWVCLLLQHLQHAHRT